MSLITIEDCPICDSLETAKVFDAVDHFATREVFPVYDCQNCGFRFTNYFPSEDNIGKYYDTPDYISHSDSKKGLINHLYHFFRKRMLKKKIELVLKYSFDSKNISDKKSQRPIRLLDIGCGTGYFLKEAREKGVKVSGIEKNSKAREYAISNFDLDVKSEDCLWEIENESFDVITLWHVLEHMQNLNEVVKKLNNILTTDGVLVLALPNYKSYDAKKYKEFWAAYDVPRHLWHFSPDTVKSILNKHNFKIIQQKIMPLDAFYISLLSEKYKGSGKIAQYIKAIIVGITGYLLSLSDFKHSGSVIYIAIKEHK